MSNENEKIRMRAEDAHDLAVIAAVLQDARITLKEMAYDPDEGLFHAAFTRYRRELPHDAQTCDGLSETDSVLTFACIAAAKHRHLQESDWEKPLSLLTIATEPGEKRLFHITLLFSGERELQLRSDCIDARLEDVGEARLATITPCNHFDESVAAIDGA